MVVDGIEPSSFSVVVRTDAGANGLEECLLRTCALDHPSFEIIVIEVRGLDAEPSEVVVCLTAIRRRAPALRARRGSLAHAEPRVDHGDR